MEKIKLGKSGLLVPPIALGCMRLADAEAAVHASVCSAR